MGQLFHITGISPKSVRQPEVFWCFQRVEKYSSGMRHGLKTINQNLVSSMASERYKHMANHTLNGCEKCHLHTILLL